MSRLLKLACLALVALMCFLFTSCTNEKEQQKIIDAFNSFESSDDYIFQTVYEFHLGKTVIPNSKLTYNEQRCTFLTSTDTCAYGYCESEDRITTYIVCLDYETLAISLCDIVSLPSTLINASFYNNSFYFRTDDPSTEEFEQMYTVYDMSTKKISSCNTDNIDSVEHREIYKCGDYEFSCPDFPLSGDLKMKIKSTKTNTVKYFSTSVLKKCDEGKIICKLPKNNMNLGGTPSDVHVINDDIYILCYQSVSLLGYPSYYFIVKYNFETENIEYYSTIYFKDYPENTYFFHIPNTENSTLN